MVKQSSEFSKEPHQRKTGGSKFLAYAAGATAVIGASVAVPLAVNHPTFLKTLSSERTPGDLGKRWKAATTFSGQYQLIRDISVSPALLRTLVDEIAFDPEMLTWQYNYGIQYLIENVDRWNPEGANDKATIALLKSEPRRYMPHAMRLMEKRPESQEIQSFLSDFSSPEDILSNYPFYKKFAWSESILLKVKDVRTMVRFEPIFAQFGWFESQLREISKPGDIIELYDFFQKFSWVEQRLKDTSHPGLIREKFDFYKRFSWAETHLRMKSGSYERDKDPSFYRQFSWHADYSLAHLSVEKIFQDFEKYRQEPWLIDKIRAHASISDMLRNSNFFKQTFPDWSRMLKVRLEFLGEYSLSHLTIPVTPSMDSDMISQIKDHVYKHPNQVIKQIGTIREIFTEDEIFMLLTRNMDAWTWTEIITHLRKADSRGTPLVSERLLSAVLNYSMYSTDRYILELGMNFFDKNNRSWQAPHYRKLILSHGVPSQIEWADFYSLAEEMPADISISGLGLSPEDRRLRADIRSFSEKHKKNGLQLAQAAFLVFQELHVRNISPTREAIQAMVSEFSDSLSAFGKIDPVGPNREVILISDDQTYENGRERFGLKPYVDTLSSRNGAAILHLKGSNSQQQNKESLEKLQKKIETSQRPITLIFDSHGENDSMTLSTDAKVRILRKDLLTWLLTRYKDPVLREQAISQPIIFLASDCYSRDFANLLNEELAREGAPPVIYAAASERGRVAFSNSSSPNGSDFNDAVAIARTLGELRSLFTRRSYLSKPSLFFPSARPVQSSPAHLSIRPFFQISGVTQLGDSQEG